MLRRGVRVPTAPKPHSDIKLVSEPRERFRVADTVSLVLVTAGLFTAYLSAYLWRGYEFPLGADSPVYMWWMRLAGAEGLSAVRDRPGVSGLALAIDGVLGTGPAATIAAIGVVLGLAAALAACAVVRMGSAQRDRRAWILAGVLAGLFAMNLAIGFLATHTAAAMFLATCASLARRTPAGAIVGGVLLGAADLAQPQFFAIGCSALLIGAAFSWRLDGRFRGGDAERISIVLAIGVLIAGVAMIWLAAGPGPLDVDTSRDDVLERIGLSPMLAGLFRTRLLGRLPYYVPLLLLPLVIAGLRTMSVPARQLLLAWTLLTVVGVVVGLATGWFPAERLVTFALVLPIGLGIWLFSAPTKGGMARRTKLAGAVMIVVAVSAGGLFVWLKTPPKIFPLEVARVTSASRYLAQVPVGTPIVFSISNFQPIGSFFATEAANAIRAAVPPERIRDVRVMFPPAAAGALAPTEENRRLVDLLRRTALGADGLPPSTMWFDLRPFDRRSYGRPVAVSGDNLQRPSEVSQGVSIVGSVPGKALTPEDPLRPTSPWGIAWASLLVLGLLGIAGYPLARTLTNERTSVLAMAPACGAAVLILVTTVVAR
jgi:hypothetical protein